jgi:hypothetical protein
MPAGFIGAADVRAPNRLTSRPLRCGRQGLEALSLAPGIPHRRISESVALTR